MTAKPDLSTAYLGLRLRSPLVASSSPLTGDRASLQRLDDAGVGAVVLPSLFEEQLVNDALAMERLRGAGAPSHPEASSYFPDLGEYNAGPDESLELVAWAKRTLSVPVVASLNGVSPGGWLRHAAEMEEAGADAIELNLYEVVGDPVVTSADVEHRYVELVAAVNELVSVPIAVKLSPYFTALANVATLFVEAGADGLVLFNRFYQPEIELETLEMSIQVVLSTPGELRLPLRWIGLLRPRLDVSLAATSGVHRAEDVAKVLLAGADVAMMASALLREGPEHAEIVLRRLERWMGDEEYESVRQLKGSMSRAAVADPGPYERAWYARTLSGFPGLRA